jgi:hypothetical protein
MSYRLLSLAAVAGLTLATAVAHAQNNASTTACGVETWSSDKMMYVTVPCTGGAQQGTSAAGGSSSSKSSAQSCGPETWSTDKMMYVGTPCAAGDTYENPAGSASENFNSK